MKALMLTILAKSLKYAYITSGNSTGSMEMWNAIIAFFSADTHLPVWCVWFISLTFFTSGMSVGIIIGKSIQMKRDEKHFWWNRPSLPRVRSRYSFEQRRARVQKIRNLLRMRMHA